MDIFPNEEESNLAADLLVHKYNISAQLLGRLLGTKQTKESNILLRKIGNKSPTRVGVAKRLVRRTGPGLFSGSSKSVKELRNKLLSELPDEEVYQLFERNKPLGSSITSPSYMRKPLAELKWVARGPWPIDFVETLGFPKIFAGIRPTAVLPTIDDVPPLGIPPNLVEFQEYLKKRMLDVLAQDGDKTRCVVTLPTGGGENTSCSRGFH